MAGKGRGWHGDSRLHSLARKGISTAQGCKGTIKRSRGIEQMPSNISPYFDLDLSNHTLPFIQDLHEEPEYNDRRRQHTHQVIYLTTDEYLEAIKIGTKQSIYIGDEKLNPILKDMKKGDKFSLPYLEYRMGFSKARLGQEGIHRSMASKQLGHDVIPVIVIYPSTVEKFDEIKHLFSSKVLNSIDKSKIRTHEQRRREYEKIYGERWNY